MGSQGQSGIMKLLLVGVCCLAALASANYSELQFAQFKEKFGKTYLTRSEHQLRFDIFKTNLKKIEEHNKSGASWTMGINQFSDLTPEEFESLYLGGYKQIGRPSNDTPRSQVKQVRDLPAAVDWRNV